jgi:hypothetical protein
VIVCRRDDLLDSSAAGVLLHLPRHRLQ